MEALHRTNKIVSAHTRMYSLYKREIIFIIDFKYHYKEQLRGNYSQTIKRAGIYHSIIQMHSSLKIEIIKYIAANIHNLKHKRNIRCKTVFTC